ncbi:hypothetical protein ACULX4_004673 [Yersinia enterocolitica]
MNNDLEQFSEETLHGLISGEYFPSTHAAQALARIALAAKRAEPNELADAVNEFLSVLDNYPEQLVPINREAALVKDLRKALSSTPQLNSPEIPEGWKLVPIELTAEMAQAAGEAHEGESYLPYSIYRAMLAAAPEKENG